jgi:hypothetical protein
MRKEILATLLISALWIASGIAVAYSAWYRAMQGSYPDFYHESVLDPFLLGVLLFGGTLILTFIIIRAILPSRETQRRKLMRLLDEVGIEDVETIQRKLSTLSDEYGAETIDRAESLESPLREGKRKNQA